MILSNLTKTISSAMRYLSVAAPATYGGDMTFQGYYTFCAGTCSANGNIKKRMQNYNTNEAPYSYGAGSSLNTLICVGIGTTPPTIDDTKLENAILNLDFLGGSCAGSYQTITATSTWQNNTGAPVTINELGIHFSSDINSTNTSYTKAPFVILTRSVLEQPVVMQDGDSRTFSIAINFNKMLETATNG